MNTPSLKKYSPEVSGFILSWLKGSFKKDEVRSLSEYGWSLIDEFARSEVITSVLFYKFKEFDALKLIPQAIRDNWQQHFYNNLKRNETALCELAKVLNERNLLQGFQFKSA